MSFKKRVNGSWTDTPNYIMGTSIDTITTLPADIYPTGTTTTVGLKGQMEQNGTPTPTTPIQPQETGDMSNNLWSYHPDTTSGGVRLLWDGEKINYSNTCTQSGNSIMAIDLKKGTYTLKVNANRIPVENENSCIDIYHSSSGLFKKITNRNAVNGKITFTLDNDLSNVQLRIRVDKGTNYDDFEIRPMLNIGETSLPYDVYGQYKIPISSANTTTPIYLGEVETTRKIKKLVLTGEENWYVEGSDIFYSDPITEAIQYPPICSHFIGVQALSDNNQVAISQFLRINIKTNSITHTTSDFKSYLAAQYAAGIPVTVWYVLATPETAVVNEPLHKIGDYADEVSGITIPTIAGANTIDVDTTLKPSEVSINYKGWHPVIDVHKAENGQWN